MIVPTSQVAAEMSRPRGSHGHAPPATRTRVIDAGVEIYRSFLRRDCEERGFVLGAVGISSVIVLRSGQFSLEVAEADAPRALDHLHEYEAENRPAQPAPLPPPLHRNAWAGCVGYTVCLLAV